MRILMIVLPLFFLLACSSDQTINLEEENVKMKAEIASLEMKLQQNKNEKESLVQRIISI